MTYYYPSHLRFTESTSDPKNTGLRKTTAHVEFAICYPGHIGTQSEVLIYLVFLISQSLFLVLLKITTSTYYPTCNTLIFHHSLFESKFILIVGRL
ncbi:hypothetical protein MTR67_039019 [Solanum verrucosum]|uniref:Uncharacterized protein n=1 Tax=Solanum verrucosum TaxID=315347 RepID=A0AAF0ZQS4_SOLVR|nr:hypothetical protein MTR67_039019 [Solanum verrucosum]